MTPIQAIRHFGGQAQLARTVGLTRQAVDNWRSRGWIPLIHQFRLNNLTNGELPITHRKRKGNGHS